MENQITGFELPNIHIIPQEDHKKMIHFIHNQVLIATNHLSIQNQNIPSRIYDAYIFVQKQANVGKLLTKEHIRQINKCLGESGVFRGQASSWFDHNNIGINGYLPPDGDTIENLLTKYVGQFNSIDENEEPLEKICKLYLIFELIHPFKDGNGRTGRALCAWKMFSYGYGCLAPFFEEKLGNSNEQHYKAFDPYINNYLAWLGNPEYLNNFFSKFYLTFLIDISNILKSLNAKL